VLLNFLDGDPVFSSVSEEFEDEVLEVLADNFAGTYWPPVLIKVPGVDLRVEFVFGCCFLERVDATNKDEGDHAKGEDVNLFSIVHMSQIYLRSYVCLWSLEVPKLIDVLINRKTKVSKLESEILFD